MKLNEFKIGESFYLNGRRFICTDVGSRVVAAIPTTATVSSTNEPTKHLSEADTEAQGWLNGPPYAVAEMVLDEYDIAECSREKVEA